MFTTPKIKSSKDHATRAYISYSFNGKRYREYNGKRLNINLNPNQCNSVKDKERALQALQYEFSKALNNGWNPLLKEKEMPSLKIAFEAVLFDKMNSTLCDLYKRNLKAVSRMFLNFVPNKSLGEKVDDLPYLIVEAFLNQFRTSERNYINRRRCLSTFFNEMIRKGFATVNMVKNTQTAKAKATLHVPYSQKQLRDSLSFLQVNYPNLHLCCLLTYGCLLRPHHEIRQLKVRHIVKDFTQIQLSGSENKSKRIRTVHIPDFLQPILRNRLENINDEEANIFTLNQNSYNVGYFNLMWGKAKVKMLSLGLIRPNQTIYSFRHTAAVNVYQKTKDLHVLQQLLQHSNMIVTLNYLRGLGELNDERLKEVMPEL